MTHVHTHALLTKTYNTEVYATDSLQDAKPVYAATMTCVAKDMVNRQVLKVQIKHKDSLIMSLQQGHPHDSIVIQAWSGQALHELADQLGKCPADLRQVLHLYPLQGQHSGADKHRAALHLITTAASTW